jgi:hypothetical protein
MSLNQKPANTTGLKNKNLVLVVTVSLVAVISLSLLAVELFASQDYKLSNLFKKENPDQVSLAKSQTSISNQNSISSSSSTANPIQPLKADENYDVAVIDECDLAMRYKKTGNEYEKLFYKTSSGVETDTYLFNEKNKGPKSDQSVSITCDFKDEEEFQFYTLENTDKDQLSQKAELYFLSIEMLTKITNLKTGNSPQLGGIVEGKGNITGRKVYYFGYNNKRYLIKISQFQEIPNPDFQIQFNSLAPSTPSVNLEGGEKQNTQTQSFTDQIYPDLNIKYDSSWKLTTKNSLVSTDTTSDYYGGLENKEITLTKNGTVLKFNLSIARQIGCGGGTDLTPVSTAGKNYRYINDDNSPNSYVYQSYSKGILCSLDYKIISNLPSKNYPKYSFQDEPFVASFVPVTLIGSNEQELFQADQIIANSTFSTNRK